jgi:hypothetical protein|eukprot:COSAG02_NODE_4057_length_5845_cov_8.300557_5_plen_170_part_00
MASTQARPNRRKGKAPPSCSSSSSSDDEPTEEERVYWEKAEEILREYNLSKMAMVGTTLGSPGRACSSHGTLLHGLLSQGAARLWIKEMGHPVKGKSLHRVQVWFLHRMQGRKRSPPLSPWQSGCPEIIPKLRALPWWSSAQLDWLPKLQVRAPPSAVFYSELSVDGTV